MSDAYLVRRGGGVLPVNAAVLHITAPVGSSITLVKGGVTVAVLASGKGHTNAADTTVADWYYAVDAGSYGDWTITAALSGKSSSKTVTINSKKEYDVRLSYNYYIIQDGVLLREVESKNSYVNTVSENGYYKITGGSGTTNTYIYFGTFSIGGFSKAVCEVLYCYAAKQEQVRAKANGSVVASHEYYSSDGNTATHQSVTWELDMSGIASGLTGQIGLYRAAGIANSINIQITNLYLVPA